MNEKGQPEKEGQNIPDMPVQEKIEVKMLSEEKYNSKNGCCYNAA
ncbi:hypothetical protein [Dyadobacter sediminis]|nr:hypothetical protein [Dyadobacter sediminis]